jgi:predicted ATP-dependent Lon-type protease
MWSNLKTVSLHSLDAFNICGHVFGYSRKARAEQIVVLRSVTLGQNIVPIENLAESLRIAFHSGVKRLLLVHLDELIGQILIQLK